MSGRGRGRGGRGGSNKSFNREQLNALGVGGNELMPGPVTQPPPLFPLLDHKPLPITPSLELDYLLLVRQDFIDHMQTAPTFLKLSINKPNQPQQEIDKLIAQLPCTRTKFDWHLLPSELRPKMLAKTSTRAKAVKEVDVNSRLSKLEKLEMKKETEEVAVKTEVEEEEDENMLDDPDIQDEDEEMDDGTDYANNYFDNGEAYEDDDDNLDDGPIY